MHRKWHAPLAIAALLWAGTAAAEPELVWEATGLQAPESAVYDVENKVIYVSNIAGGGMDKDGVGFISIIAPDGTVTQAEWVTGLDAPKGLAIHGDKLYAADIDKLVVIDISQGAVVATHSAPDAKFFNDVTADNAGRVFVSDMFTDTIWKLEDGTFEAWLQDSALDNPNGLLAVGDKLLVAARGRKSETSEGPLPNSIKVVDIATMEISPFGSGEPIGNLDGIVADGQGGYIVSDWRAGALFHVSPSGASEMILDVDQGSADIGIIESEGIVMVPMMVNGSLAAYRLN